MIARPLLAEVDQTLYLILLQPAASALRKSITRLKRNTEFGKGGLENKFDPAGGDGPFEHLFQSDDHKAAMDAIDVGLMG